MVDPIHERIAAAVERLGLKRVAELLEVGEPSVARLGVGAPVRNTTRRLAERNVERLAEAAAQAGTGT